VKLDNPATLAAAFFLAFPLSLPLLPLPLPVVAVPPPEDVEGETEAEPEPEPPPLPPPPPEPPWCRPLGLMSGMYCSTAACPKELDAATSIPAVARTSAGGIALLKILRAPVNIAVILAASLGPEGSS
jgi:hypothetical protein